MSIDLTLDGPVATVTLDRPEALNAIDRQMRAELHDAGRRIDGDDRIMVAVITGAGERAFCVGSDLKTTMPPAESYAQQAFGPAGPDHLLADLDTDKPLICAVNGFAIGGGMELALACDIRIASHNAEFGLAEVRVGSIPAAGGTQRLPRLVGQSLAMQMLLTGDRIGAEEALRAGLVSELHPLSELRTRAHELADKIARNAPLAVRAVKRLVRDGADVPVNVGMRMEHHVWGLLRDTEDRIEGRRAFAEKRTPQYHGR